VLRRRAELDPQKHRRELADALVRLAEILRKSRRYRRAAAFWSQAAAVLRDDPDALPAFAAVLKEWGETLWDNFGYTDEAMSVQEEHVSVLRRLAEADPNTWRMTLAGELLNLTEYLEDSDRHRTLSVLREVTEVYRQAGGADLPASPRSFYAWALHDLAAEPRVIGDHDGALTASDTAVRLRRGLADEGVGVSPAGNLRTDLSRSLQGLAADLRAVGRSREADQADDEAAALLRSGS